MPPYLLEGTFIELTYRVLLWRESVILDPALLTSHRCREDMEVLFDQVEALKRFVFWEKTQDRQDMEVWKWGLL